MESGKTTAEYRRGPPDPGLPSPGGADPADPDLDLSSPVGAVGDSLSVAVWTLVSRFTGVLRGVVVAAVLGATYFANTYQFTNSLPNLIFYGLLAGALFSSILVPALVPYVDSGDARAAARTAGGLLGVSVIGMLALVPLAALATPVLLRFGSMGATDPAAAQGQERARRLAMRPGTWDRREAAVMRAGFDAAAAGWDDSRPRPAALTTRRVSDRVPVHLWRRRDRRRFVC